MRQALSGGFGGGLLSGKQCPTRIGGHPAEGRGEVIPLFLSILVSNEETER